MVCDKPAFKRTEVGLIPEEWRINKIGDVCTDIFSGGTPDTRVPEYWGGNIPWLSSGETRQTFIRDTDKKITPSGVENSSTRLAKAGDVIIASAGQGYTRGQAAFCMVDTYINQSVVALRAKKETVSPLFLFYNLSSRYNELRQISDAHSSRGSLTTRLLAGLSIQLPSMPEQEGIANVLLDLDRRIELNSMISRNLEAISQAVFKRWFVDFEFPNEEGKPYRSSGGEMVSGDELVGEIPKGWEIADIAKTAKIVDCLHSKKPDRTESGPVLLQVYNIGRDGILDLSECYNVSEDDYRYWTRNIEVKGGDCVITNAGRVGAVAQIPEGFHFGIGRNMTAIRPIEITPTYLIDYLLSKYGVSEIQNNVDTGTILDSLNVKGIVKIRILLPPKPILDQYENFGRPLRKHIEINANQTQKLSEVCDKLLPKLMFGRVRVPATERIQRNNDVHGNDRISG